MDLSADTIKSLGKKGKNFLWYLGLHAFTLILFFVLVDIVIGGVVFYQYVFLAEKHEPQTTGTIIKFNEKLYQDVLFKLNQNKLKLGGSNMITESSEI